MAPPGLAFWCGDRVGERYPGARPRAVTGARGCAQPVRARGTTLGCGRDKRHCDAVPLVYPSLGSEPDLALPTFQGRGAPADQVDSLRRLGGGLGVRERDGQWAHRLLLRTGELG